MALDLDYDPAKLEEYRQAFIDDKFDIQIQVRLINALQSEGLLEEALVVTVMAQCALTDDKGKYYDEMIEAIRCAMRVRDEKKGNHTESTESRAGAKSDLSVEHSE